MPPEIHDRPSRSRASRLPPDDRRAAIVESTIPLVRRHGYAVTTRQIAEAAGVAEGTVFRVFDDKNQLIREAICQAIEPTGLEQRIADIDRSLPVRARLIQATTLMQHQLHNVFDLLAAVRLTHPPGEEKVIRHPPPAHQKAVDEIVALIEPDHEAFRVSPQQVERLLRVLTFAGSHVGITDGRPMSADEIVSVLLDGVQARPSHSPGANPC